VFNYVWVGRSYRRFLNPSSSFISDLKKLLPRLLTDVILCIWHEIVSGQIEISQHAFALPSTFITAFNSKYQFKWEARTNISHASRTIWRFFPSLFRVNVTRLFRTKPTASVLESSFDPDIQVVKIKSHVNDVFYEISVIGWLKGNTGLYVSTILVITICFELDGINSSENLTNL